MYNDNYYMQPREIPLVAFYKHQDKSIVEEEFYIFTLTHYHSDTEFILIESGRGEFYINGQKYPFCPGNIFLVNPYEPHYAIASTEYDLKYYCIDFDMNMLFGGDSWSIARKYIEGERILSHFCTASPLISKRIQKICEQYERNKDGWMLEAIGNLFLIFAEIERKKMFRSADGQGDAAVVKKICDYIEQEYATNMTSRDVAACLGYNHSYFCRMFRRHFGTNFGKFLNDYRIKKARRLLESSFGKISDIAVATGFNSISYFSEYFRKATGLTPSQYLKQHQQNAFLSFNI